MNRSLGTCSSARSARRRPPSAETAAAATTAARSDRSAPRTSAILLSYAQNVIVVPGYGLAVAQAQHSVRELADLLESKGINVKYAIHPVAGRMPGHMNVLLAEANVPYDKLFDMEQINPEFQRADVALVIGANDVDQSGGASNPGSADLRHADPRRRQGAEHHRHQALDEARFRGHRQRSLSPIRRPRCFSAMRKRPSAKWYRSSRKPRKQGLSALQHSCATMSVWPLFRPHSGGQWTCSPR